ncbi:hypothetical protein IV203_004236 [Nitzschia inconspicua]|uniref:Uncharacterized protein n=1 Tax=Nitzschia inconspicua TaxID=303405 RepID=A0A9K3PP46_9STRA|nr:hypothetical protein IV203_004236 [Nitzschia inconspicua]
MNEQEENDMTDSVQCDESASASGKQKYNTSTKKPTTPHDVCPFRLNIYMVSEEAPVDPGRWFVSHKNVNKKTCGCHKGHVKLRPHELHNYLTNMSEEDRELAKKCVKLRFSASATAALLDSTSTTCSTYQANQISYLSRLPSELGKPNRSTAHPEHGCGDDFPKWYSFTVLLPHCDFWVQSQRHFAQACSNTGASTGH